MEIKMGITRADVEVMVDKILDGDVEVSDFTDENLGEQLIDLVQYFGDMGRRSTAITKAEECLEKYLKKVGADFGKIFAKPELLDKVEKEYLGNLLKPYLKKDVRVIVTKHLSWNGDREWINIHVGFEDFDLPYFNRNTMYKGLKVDREYTVEELSLR